MHNLLKLSSDVAPSPGIHPPTCLLDIMRGGGGGGGGEEPWFKVGGCV